MLNSKLYQPTDNFGDHMSDFKPIFLRKSFDAVLIRIRVVN